MDACHASETVSNTVWTAKIKKESVMNSLKDMVSGGKVVKFEYYRKGELWYSTECGFMFPVPIDDTGDGTFAKQDKAMLFMRYIRKHMEAIEKEAA